jgi:AbrB family looped-hinge helix DNA binding protein
MMRHKMGKYIYGTVKVGERGQIVIPKEAREQFNIKPGDSLIVFGRRKRGIALVKADIMNNFMMKIFGNPENPDEENDEQ